MAKVYDLDEIFSHDGWNGLYDILHGASYKDVVAMLIASGCPDFEEEHYSDGLHVIWVFGYYSDESPIIEFENGIVARWYRQVCFD